MPILSPGFAGAGYLPGFNPFARPGMPPYGATTSPPKPSGADSGDMSGDAAPSPGGGTASSRSSGGDALANALVSPASSAVTDLSNGIGPPPSDALAKALLQNEEDIPLHRPFEAVGKLAALWGAQNAQKDYNKQVYDRQVAPYRMLTEALAGQSATDNPIAYRRKLGQTMMTIGSQAGNPDMINKGLDIMSSASQPVWEKGQDGAGNTIWWDQLDPTHTMVMDQNGQPVELKNGQPIQRGSATPAGAASGAASTPPGGAASGPAAPAGDPYAKFRLPRNLKESGDVEGYNAYLQQQSQLGTPPDKVKDFDSWSLDRSRAGAIQQSITVDPQKKAADVLADSVAKRYSGMIEGVEGAYGRQHDIHAMQGALQRIQQSGGTTGLGQGELTDLQNAINTGANALGLDQQFDISDKEFLSKFNRQLAGQMAKSAAGARVTNFEMSNYLKSNPGLELSPQGNARLLGIMEQIEQRNIDLGNALGAATEQAVSSGKTIDLPALHKIVADYDAAHHIVDPISGQDLTVNPKVPELQRSGGKAGAGAPTPAPAAGAPAGHDPLGILK